MLQLINTFKNLFFYRKLIKKNDLCFDIGANLGVKSKLYLSLRAKVIAFEPQAKCYKTLQKIKLKHTNFEVNKKAIGSKNGELDLFLGNHIEIATLSSKFKTYFTTENIYWNKKETVKVVTLNSQIEKYGIPDFCKIDAEGYEYEILRTLNHKIPIIEFEFTGGFIEETLLCLSKIDTLGNYSFNYILNENLQLKLKNWITADEMYVKIKSMSIENLHGNILAKTIQ
ncbi:FkbM family methyltransferase [Winogradskyella sp. Asnod2-B02-A]|uniref:FkbM family methyltransferase n=1 Tax=Winogradskyella sp. Asnod2-B02-A TaxID=3160583 RepID=UPI00386E743F